MANLSPETRKRILEEALKLFAEKGYDHVRIEDIAKHADINKVTVYRYFPTKDCLLVKLLEEIGRDYLTAIREADNSIRGCRKKLIALIRASLNFFDQNRHLQKLLDRAALDHDRNKDFPWLDVQQQYFRMLHGLLVEGIARGEFIVDVEDVQIVIRSLIGTMRFLFLYPYDDFNLETIPERIVKILVRPTELSQSKRAA